MTKNVHAVALGRAGGRRSAATLMQRTTPAERAERASVAAVASWGDAARAKRLANGRAKPKRRAAMQRK
jgi:hypothetical protein